MKVVLMVLVAGSWLFAQHGSGGTRGGGHTVRSTRGSGRFFAPPAVSHSWHSPAVIVPYPVFYGGSYFCDPSICYSGGGDPSAAPAPASGYTAPNGYSDDSGPNGPEGQPPVVILNQNFQPPTANGVMHDYSNVPLPPAAPNPDAKPDDQPTIYLIAMTDHTILAAIAYWVDGDTLDYITQDGDQNRISLALVDRDFSRKLNTDRGVEFRLPAAK